MSIDESKLLKVLQSHWGYDEFRPLQREIIDAVMSQRDSVVVLPTGGGKSLCYQLPAMLMPGLAIVVSPLISLMKDQVDALTECGVPAAAVHSAVAWQERQRIAEQIRADRIKLLYVAPERLVGDKMLDFLSKRTVSFIAIDEAHCISNWGHDFRPEYRMLGGLRRYFPNVAIHAFTATATRQVREDIADQLCLRKTEYFVGNFDRPNLLYRVMRRANSGQQIHDVLRRHAGESGIIYCISRKEVDALALALQAAGVKAAPYHAGLSDEERHRNQDAFLNEQVDVIVATVAFGMGIDKSNVRFVIHTGAPKSLEHYQQETGRAGRDGLDAECCLLYGGNDFHIWRKLSSGGLTPDAFRLVDANLRVMESFCSSVKCRHRALVEHFGQSYEKEDCQACDVCLEMQDCVLDALVISQKILSCVLRVNEGFGADYVAQVLTGSQEQRILDNLHHKLSTYALLNLYRKHTVRGWIEQLCEQGFICREGEYRILKVTATGREVLRGQQTPKLLTSSERRAARDNNPPRRNFTEGMDAGLFETLRQLRRRLAEERGVPPFVVFGDVTLQDLARRRPTTLVGFLQVHGVGQHKAQQYGESFVAEVANYCQSHGIATDVSVSEPAVDAAAIVAFSQTKSPSKDAAEKLFREGRSIDEVVEKTARARSTVTEYLAEFLAQEGHLTPEPWLDDATFAAIADAAKVVGTARLKPLFEHFNGQYSYDQIRISVVCVKNRED